MIPEEPSLLCICDSGFADSLNQISICVDYSRLTSRNLIITTCFPGLVRNALTWLDWGNLGIRVYVLENRNQLPFRFAPWLPTGFLNVEGSRLSEADRLALNSNSNFEGLRTTFSVSRTDYSDPLLVYSEIGGGKRSLSLIRELSLNTQHSCRLEVPRELENARFAFIHVRASDYQSDYFYLFEKVRESSLVDKFYVATDNPSIIESARLVLSGEVIWLPHASQDSQPIHWPGALSSESADMEATRLFSEFLIASLASEMYFTFVNGRAKGDKRILISGITLLFREFFEDKSLGGAFFTSLPQDTQSSHERFRAKLFARPGKKISFAKQRLLGRLFGQRFTKMLLP